MKPYTVTQIDAALRQARGILAICKGRGDTIGATRIRFTLDRLLDQRLEAVGPPRCQMAACGRPMNTYGTRVYLCPECDFRECPSAEHGGCGRRIVSLTSVACTYCGHIAAA